MNLQPLIRTYVVPASVFQGVIVGGAYGTGREVVEYVSRHGPLGGFLACLVIGLSFSVILATGFAFAQRFQIRNYRHFLKMLLGRAWLIYEALFILLLIVVLAVVGSAAGEMFKEHLGFPYWAGVGLVFGVVVVLGFGGRHRVEQSLVVWTIALMFCLFVLIGYVMFSEISTIKQNLARPSDFSGAAVSGLQFSLYNSALVPVLIYCTAGINTQQQAIISGVVAGVFGAIPALLLHITFIAYYPTIVQEALPVYALLQTLNHQFPINIYFIILSGTIILTAVGVLQGVSERVDGLRVDGGNQPLSRMSRALIAGGLLLVSIALSKFGIVALVAQGYGNLAWAFFAVFTLPLLTLGMGKLLRSNT